MTLTKSMNTTASAKAFDDAKVLMPGGVSSPVRAFKGVGGSPLFIDSASGPYVFDIDGNRYIDYVGSYGPAILGHAPTAVVQAVQQVAGKGFSFGAPTQLESQLAKMVIDAVPSVEKVRFVNSGTEAALSAARLARAFTKREKLIKFAGCYHGHADAFLAKAGSGVTTLGLPDSPGVPQPVAANTLTATFNDVASVAELLEANKNQVAAILVEPVAGNMGCIPPVAGFLEGLRQLADEHGALLVFDEVMTGFRVAYGGAQSLYNVQPDITCFGKVIGGGLPVGAYGGRGDIMAMVAPEGAMYQAGTLSGNPLAMTAGIETLKQLQQPGVYDQLTSTAQTLADGINEVFTQAGQPIATTAVGGMLGFYMVNGPVTNFEDACQVNRDAFTQLFWRLLENGVYLAPSPFEAMFVSLAHSPEVISSTINAFQNAINN
jgi:glutamate-1-semialdehyde 2,1-aminomutase